MGKKSFQETNFLAVAEFEGAVEATGLNLQLPSLPHMQPTFEGQLGKELKIPQASQMPQVESPLAAVPLIVLPIAQQTLSSKVNTGPPGPLSSLPLTTQPAIHRALKSLPPRLFSNSSLALTDGVMLYTLGSLQSC